MYVCIGLLILTGTRYIKFVRLNNIRFYGEEDTITGPRLPDSALLRFNNASNYIECGNFIFPEKRTCHLYLIAFLWLAHFTSNTVVLCPRLPKAAVEHYLTVDIYRRNGAHEIYNVCVVV